MSLINCKISLEKNWIENCVLSSAGTSATFKKPDAKLYVPIVTLPIKDNVKLAKQFGMCLLEHVSNYAGKSNKKWI